MKNVQVHFKLKNKMACNQILVFSLLTRRLLMMPPSFLNFLIIFLYLTLIGKKHWGFGDKHYWFT